MRKATTSRVRLPAIMIAATAVATGCASQYAPISHANGVSVKGSAPASDAPMMIRCTPITIGYVGVVRPGEAQAAQNALGSALLAQLTDSVSGTIDVTRSANGMSATTQSTYFSQWKPVLSQSEQASLQSCEMLLSDRPAAQPIIDAAVSAVAQHGYVASALRSELQEVFVADNPLTAGSVIVALLVPGPVVPNPPGASGGPVVHGLDAFTVIMQQSTDEPTGVAQGGF